MKFESLFNPESDKVNKTSTFPQGSAIDPQDDNGIKPDKCIGKIEIKNVNFVYPTRPDVQVRF